jgi:shikimate kinase
MPILQKKEVDERDEQLKILATNLEVINQRLAQGVGGGGAVDLSNTERLIDSQHNFIVKTVKQMEERIARNLEQGNTGALLQKEQQMILNAVKMARNEIIKEVRENNIFSELNKGEHDIMQEIRKSMQFSLALNKNLPVLFDLLKETIRLLREQNELLRQE